MRGNGGAKQTGWIGGRDEITDIQREKSEKGGISGAWEETRQNNTKELKLGGTPTFFDFAVLAFSKAVVPRGGSQQSTEVREEETWCTLKICAPESKCTLSCEERKQRERKKERKRSVVERDQQAPR